MSARTFTPLASELCNTFGCVACKRREDSEFLTAHNRFWCSKGKTDLDGARENHKDCPHWTFNGNDELVAEITRQDRSLPFTDEEEDHD